jgi:hypothetical protein
VCEVSGGDCADPAGPAPDASPGEGAAAPQEDTPGDPGPTGAPSGTDAPRPPGQVDQDDVDSARELLDEFLRDPSFWESWFGGKPDRLDVYEALQELNPAELTALLGPLSDEQLAELAGLPGGQEPFTHMIQQHILANASLDIVRRMQGMEPPYFSPAFDEVANTSTHSAEYGPVPDAVLYRDDISLSDIHQQQLSDCWYMASLGILAEHDPQAIRDMIRQNPNGSFTVTFPDTGDSVTVSPDLPLNGSSPVFADAAGDPPELWPAIMEKALAEREGGYQHLEVDSVQRGLEILTGEEATSHAPDALSIEELQAMDDRGEGMAFLTPPADEADGSRYGDDVDPGDRLTAFHFYVVTDVDAEAGTVDLYNPWGGDALRRTVRYDEIAGNFSGIQSMPLRD